MTPQEPQRTNWGAEIAAWLVVATVAIYAINVFLTFFIYG